MANVAFTPAIKSVEYFLNLEKRHQENIKPEEPFQVATVVFNNLQSPAATVVFNNLQSQTVILNSANILQFRGSVGITSQIEEVLNQLHQDWIKIPKPGEVRDYLLRYSDLTGLLPFICKIARERVGIRPELSLEVYHDPEIEDEYLTLYIRQEHYDEHILDIIEYIRTQYEGKFIGRSGWLLVTTDFRPLENSTAQKECPKEIDQRIENLFEITKDQVFEDGIESEFSKELISLIEEYGNDAMMVIANLIISEKVNAEIASEALRWLGHMNHPETYRYRLWVLEQSLFCSSVRIRDGAVLGLSFLNDSHAVPYLKRAIERETCKELRQDMEQVLAHLENTR